VRDNAGMSVVYIGLLRGINIGGHATVSMGQLRDSIAEAGFAAVRSLLNSGNVVFRGDAQSPAEIEVLLERETAKQFDARPAFFVRTAEELATVIADNPFPEDAARDPGHLVVMFLKAAAEPSAVDALRAAVAGPEVIYARGRHLYITYPAGIGRSRLTNALIETKLGTRGTARNWNTVLKLSALAQT